MLQIENGIQIAADDYYIQHMEGGLDELHFEVTLSDPAYYALCEESRILETTEQQTYTVKLINAGRRTAKISCVLDLCDWQTQLYMSYKSGSRTAGAVLTSVVPSGWTVINTAVNQKKREIEMDAPTALEIVEQMQDTFGCAVRFDTASKTATLLYPEEKPLSNAYAVDTVNLRSAPEFKGKTSDLYTRLYPIGKDGLSIATVNGGKAYVENLTYTSKIICAVWKDERYTDAESLRDDAQARVDAASQPERSWTLDIVDLNRLNSRKWPDMGLSMFTVLRLVDSYKGFQANVQVREDKVYPYYPEKNEITVSTAAKSVQRTLKSLYRQMNNPNSSFYQRLNAR